MLRPLPFALAALALATSLCAQNPGGEGRRPRGRQEPVELRNFTFQECTFPSIAVGKEMPYGVYLPKGYDAPENKDVKWPLVVWLHWMFEDHLRFHRRGGAPVLDKAVDEKLLPPCVFVLANGGKTSMYINAGKDRDYQDLVQKDLIAHVDETYRVSKERGQRALMGISMGGMAALRVGFTHPQLFGTVAVHSSAVFPSDPAQLQPGLVERAKRFGLDMDLIFGNPIDAKLWAQTNPLGLAEAVEARSLDGLRLYFDAGTDDHFQFGKTNLLLHEALTKKEIPHTWELVQGGGHAWGSGFRDESLLASLTFVGESFAKAAEAGVGKPPATDGSGNGDGKGAAPAKKGS